MLSGRLLKPLLSLIVTRTCVNGCVIETVDYVQENQQRIFFVSTAMSQYM